MCYYLIYKKTELISTHILLNYKKYNQIRGLIKEWFLPEAVQLKVLIQEFKTMLSCQQSKWYLLILELHMLLY